MGGSFTRRDRTIYKDTISVTLASTSYAIVFPTPMTGDYDIYILAPQSLLMVNGISNKTLAGFTMALSVTLAGLVTWLAVEKM